MSLSASLNSSALFGNTPGASTPGTFRQAACEERQPRAVRSDVEPLRRRHLSARQLGYSRDRKPGTLQVDYGLLFGARGCPVSVSVLDGNTGDPKTLLPQVERLKEEFGLASLVRFDDRSMISNVPIDAMRTMYGID